MEGDFVLFEVHHITCYFNPLPPYGGRRGRRGRGTGRGGFQSNPSVWREPCGSVKMETVSLDFNPLPPYGGRPERRCLAMKRFKFQSTPSVWRETFCSSAFRDTLSFQSTPSVWRETDTIIPIYLDGSISIHSLRMEGDYIYYTPSQNRSISIHSLRMEGDEVKTVGYIATNISIHSLRMEGDRSKVSVLLPVMPFQSTPSVWRET